MRKLLLITILLSSVHLFAQEKIKISGRVTSNKEPVSGASVNVHPIVSLKADANSGASINYYTTPKNIEKTENSGGSISQG